MHLVHEEDGALPELPAALLRLRDGVDGDEVAARGVGDDASEGGLARARRAVEDDRAELVGLDGPAQKPPRPDNVLLADEFIERARAHPRGERRLTVGQLVASDGKEVVGGFG